MFHEERNKRDLDYRDLIHWFGHAFPLPLRNACFLLTVTSEIRSFLFEEGSLFAYASVNTPGSLPFGSDLRTLREGKDQPLAAREANQAYRTSSTGSGIVSWLRAREPTLLVWNIVNAK